MYRSYTYTTNRILPYLKNIIRPGTHLTGMWAGKGGFLENLKLLLLSLVAFSLPFNFRTTTFLLISFGVITIFHFFRDPTKIQKKAIYFALPSVGYYLLFAISYFYSSDKTSSLLDLQTKFSLFALPFLILLWFRSNKLKINLIFSFFIAGLLFFEIIGLVHATYHFIKTGDPQGFYYHQLVGIYDINAAYFSWYVLFSLVILLLFKLNLQIRFLVPIIGFQIVYLFLLSSRAVEAVFVFLLIPYALYYHRNKHRNKKYYIGLTALYITLLAFSFVHPGIFNKRLNNINIQNIQQAFLPKYHHHSYEFNNINTRLFFWRVGIDNIKKSNVFFGVGNGDVNAVQNQRMDELGILNIFNKEKPSDFFNTNLHNMYLQSILAIGILGMLLLLLMIGIPLILAWKSSDPILFWFQLIAALFMLHESIFETQAGVVFYIFFSMLLTNYALQQPKVAT